MRIRLLLVGVAAVLFWFWFRNDSGSARAERPGGCAPDTEAARQKRTPDPERDPTPRGGQNGKPAQTGPRAFLRTGAGSWQTLAPGRGAIDFALSLPPAIDPAAFHVVLFRERKPAPVRKGARGPYAPERDQPPRQFTFPDLEPGAYTVRYFLTGDAVALADVTGVVVQADRITRDPRLSDPPLAMHVRAARIEVVDEAGQPVAGADVCLDADPEQFYSQAHVVRTDATGRVTIPVTARGQRPLLRKRGYRIIAPGLVTKNARFVLPPGLAVRLRLDTEGRDVPDDAVLLLRFRHLDSAPDPDGPLDAWVPGLQTWTESSRRPLTLHFARHGTYEVEAYVAPRTVKRYPVSMPPSPIGSFPGDYSLTVRDLATRQPLTLAIPAEDLAAAVADLRDEQDSMNE